MTYRGLVVEVQGVLDAHALQHQRQQQQQQQPRPGSPSFMTNLPNPKSRLRSNTSPTAPSSSSSLHSLSSPSQVQPFHHTQQQQLQHSHAQLAYKQLVSAFYTINSKYRISWECAELLIELGGTSSAASAAPSSSSGGISSPPSTSVSAPVMGAGLHLNLNLNLHLNLIGKKGSGGRERAITLAGDKSKPSSPVPGATPSSPVGATTATATAGPPLASPPSLAWRASTGRHDLSHRQLVLLREMLHKADNSPPAGGSSIPEEQPQQLNTNVQHRQTTMSPTSLNVNKDWRWGDAMNSTVTLPSEESGRSSADPRKKRRYSRLGMSGFRDMLRALKRNHNDAPPPLPAPPPPPVLASSTSLSTDNSSLDRRLRNSHAPPAQGRRPKTTSGLESVCMSRPTSPCNSPSRLPTYQVIMEQLELGAAARFCDIEYAATLRR
jgi:serine/arginine repetitive matrix protein 2